MEKLKVFEAFSGVGSQSMALRNLAIDYEVVATADIDKYAIISYAAIHNNLEEYIGEIPQNREWKKEVTEKLAKKGIKAPRSYKKLRWLEVADELSNNLGDISKIKTEEIPDHDLFTYSFPCQDISLAGKQKGLSEGEGTRSGLLWECKKVIETKKPSYLLLENVKNLVGKKHKKDFDKWLEWLETLGYTNYWKVINATEHGVPQNRERVFVVSFRDDRYFRFGEPQELELRLKDILEDEVDEKYYIDNEKAKKLIYNIKHNKIKEVGYIPRNDGKQHQSNTIYSPEGVFCTMQARDYKDPMKILINNYDEPIVAASRGRYDKDGNINQNLEARKDGLSNTITTVQKDNYLIEDFKLRKLTPKECWRLMGFSDEDFDKASKYNSNSQLYKQAGNSIVVDVLESIFRQIFLTEEE